MRTLLWLYIVYYRWLRHRPWWRTLMCRVDRHDWRLRYTLYPWSTYRCIWCHKLGRAFVGRGNVRRHTLATNSGYTPPKYEDTTTVQTPGGTR